MHQAIKAVPCSQRDDMTPVTSSVDLYKQSYCINLKKNEPENLSKLYCYPEMEESIARYSTVPTFHLSIEGVGLKETHTHTDKALKDVPLDVLVYCRNNIYHIVKDICIDNGCLLDTALTGSDKAICKQVVSAIYSDVEEHELFLEVCGSTDCCKEMHDLDHQFNPRDKEVFCEKCSKKLTNEAALDTDEACGSIDIASDAMGMSEKLQEPDRDPVDFGLAFFGIHEDQELPHKTVMDTISEHGESESDKSSSGSLRWVIRSRAEGSEDTGHSKKLGCDTNVSSHEDHLHMNSSAGSSHGLLVHHGLRESTLSSIHSVSDDIAHPGQLSYCGSISLRSDSSSGSTRSFAFPILHTEWNSSPVRMAKADPRLLRKHRGWRMGLLCCRF